MNFRHPLFYLFVVFLLTAVYLFFFANYDVAWTGFFSIMIFYGLIFYFGQFASRFRKHNNAEEVLLAGRSIPLYIAVFTMSATWIGGGFINGTAEATASSGLLWVQAPWGYALSLMIGGLFFARKMRRGRYRTMLDPIREKFGQGPVPLFFLPALTGELFWTAAILTALGTTFATVLGIDNTTAIILSALVAIGYTMLGGLWAVAITDVLQLLLLFFGLLIVVPSSLSRVGDLNELWQNYQLKFGTTATLLPSRAALGNYFWNWWDYALLLVFGGIPWQVYFQRVLSAKDEKTAMWLSIFAGFICLLAAVPAVIIGMIGATFDWTGAGLMPPPDAATTLPHVIRYLCSPLISTIGLGAIAAAVMSSVDSSILSASSMSGWNIYRPLFKPGISSAGLARVIKKSIGIIGVAATLIALQVGSVYELWFLCSDFVYCLLFPVLVCALFDPRANRSGAVAGFLVALVLRFGGGDTTLGIPVFLPYPMIENGVVLFPFRTVAMLSGLFTILVVSRITGRINADS